MTDDAYIKPSDRYDYCGGPWACGRYDEIFESHAAVDSIAAEAIDIIWSLIKNREDLSGDAALNRGRAFELIKRFDNLTKAEAE